VGYSGINKILDYALVISALFPAEIFAIKGITDLS